MEGRTLPTEPSLTSPKFILPTTIYLALIGNYSGFRLCIFCSFSPLVASPLHSKAIRIETLFAIGQSIFFILFQTSKVNFIGFY